MKKLLKPVIFFISIFYLPVSFSCSEEFLIKEPPGVAAGSLMTSPEGVESILIGAYSYLRGRYLFGGALGTDWMYGSIPSDDCYYGAWSTYPPLERYEANPSHPYVLQRWQECYNGVQRANNTLEFLALNQEGNNPISRGRALQIEGEAKFLRAWFHFQANKVFENIPYIKTKAELYPLPPEKVPNTDPAWNAIEEDLQFAIDNLPETPPSGEPGRVTRYAAMAVKAHAHMFQKEFPEAKQLLDAIINCGQYDLAPEFWHNYDMTHENNKESIFEIQAATTSTAYSSVAPAGAAFYQKGPASCGGWGMFQPSQCLFEAFQVTPDGLPVLDIENRDPLANDMGLASSDSFIPTDHLLDPRVDWTISRRGIDFLGWGINPGSDWIREMYYGGPYMTKKYMHLKSEQSLNNYGTGFYNGKNYRMYRLANILLWRAEIAVEEGELELARSLVNRVRERAKNSTPVMGLCTSYSNLGKDPAVDWTKPAANYKIEPWPEGHPAFASKEEARKAVRMEIRLEFATEGHRFFDLRRWEIDDEVLNDYIVRDSRFRIFLSGVKYNPEKHDYWPLPSSATEEQKGIIQQDPAYVTAP
ncbi:MAG: RagB/SusD family nutrient uptake outer membrane protein [Bacteroidales bacterium]|nr:RagB/SusD family nutrient uptake outer membrane protein [Bacteroidales bacterium]